MAHITSLRTGLLIVLLLGLLLLSFANPASVAAESGPHVVASITRTHPHAVRYGKTITFTMTATNIGDEPATNATIEAWGPDWFNAVSHTCSSVQPVDDSTSPRCTVDTLNPGQSITLVAVFTPANNVERHVYEQAMAFADGQSEDVAEVKVEIAGSCHAKFTLC